MGGPTTEDFHAPRSDKDLAETFATRRRGVSDPVRQVAAELENITETLLEVLKHLRRIERGQR